MENKILWDIIDGLRDELNITQDSIVDLSDVVKELQKERNGFGEERDDLRKNVDQLQAENKKLKSDYKNDIDASYELDDKHVDIIKDLERKIKEHEKEYHLLASSKTSHYPKEIKDEADEYFHHNPQCDKLFFFMVGGDEVDEDGDVTRTLNVECDTIAECDNIDNKAHVELYK